jgi:GxxExxY protein
MFSLAFLASWRIGFLSGRVMNHDRRNERTEPGQEYDLAAHAVIGAAIEVHRHLGPGFLEGVYQNSLEIEMAARSIPFERKKRIEIFYKGQLVGKGQLDLLVAGILVVELKTVETIAPIHQAQVISYLKALDRPLGLLINFKTPLLEDGAKRIVLSRRDRQDSADGAST